MGKLSKNNILHKTYSYEKNKATLNFTLRQDIKTEMESFLEILREAISDVEKDLNANS